MRNLPKITKQMIVLFRNIQKNFQTNLTINQFSPLYFLNSIEYKESESSLELKKLFYNNVLVMSLSENFLKLLDLKMIGGALLLIVKYFFKMILQPKPSSYSLGV
jgi:hypothetical protein